ncbi:MAG: translation initiation factor IF-3 [Proteobacteria bacterium]|nr:translation initiation factor IF-3 [Pseudomonadota bacterium]
MPPRRPSGSGFNRPVPPSDDGPRVNEQIKVNKVRLIDENGNQVGVVNIRDAQQAAYDAGLDLIEISPNADPPVCKVLDHGKYKYEQQKKAAEARKKQKIVDIKEIKIRPAIEEHDYQVKLRNAQRFLEDGDKVKVTLRFRGREMAHLGLGMEVLKRFKEDLSSVSKVEMEPRMEGRQAMMVLTPENAK